MREWVIISGKGGAGKTSLTASFALLAKSVVLADADVDAPDLHLLMNPQVRETRPFSSGANATIRHDKCTSCGMCFEVCRFEAIGVGPGIHGAPAFHVKPSLCEGCGVCAWSCPQQAIDLQPADTGVWMVSDTRAGPMVHARLKPAADHSGKLAAQVRREARAIAERDPVHFILVDGPPGIGCPVIASLSGADRVLVVAEPTPPAAHDAARALELVRHFNIPAAICVNKWDLHPELTEDIERKAEAQGACVVGRISYSKAFTNAMRSGLTVVEAGGRMADEIQSVWTCLLNTDTKGEPSCE